MWFFFFFWFNAQDILGQASSWSLYGYYLYTSFYKSYLRPWSPADPNPRPSSWSYTRHSHIISSTLRNLDDAFNLVILRATRPAATFSEHYRRRSLFCVVSLFYHLVTPDQITSIRGWKSTLSTKNKPSRLGLPITHRTLHTQIYDGEPKWPCSRCSTTIMERTSSASSIRAGAPCQLLRIGERRSLEDMFGLWPWLMRHPWEGTANQLTLCELNSLIRQLNCSYSCSCSYSCNCSYNHYPIPISRSQHNALFIFIAPMTTLYCFINPLESSSVFTRNSGKRTPMSCLAGSLP